MIADRAWFKRNLGYDPVDEPPPANTFAFEVSRTSDKPEDWQREIIDFDSDAPSGLQFWPFSTATGLSRFKDIPWPEDQAPVTAADAGSVARWPSSQADVLVVTWTVDEGHALSRVLTPGKDSHNDYLSYTHNYAAISQDMRADCPAIEAKRLGAYWRSTIDGKSVVVFKSELPHVHRTAPNCRILRSGGRSSARSNPAW